MIGYLEEVTFEGSRCDWLLVDIVLKGIRCDLLIGGSGFSGNQV